MSTGLSPELGDVTAIIKTIMRPACLNRLVESIRRYYPRLKILIADDSTDASASHKFGPDVTVIPLPYDTGLGAARNVLVDAVQTGFLLYLDDDYVFTEKTKIEVFRQILDANNDIDIVGGAMLDFRNGAQSRRLYHGLMRRQGDDLVYTNGCYQKRMGSHPVEIVDVILNFFLARTESVKKVMFDGDLKINTHTDFFLRAMGKLKVAFTPAVEIIHQPERSAKYTELRERKYVDLMKKKHGFKRQVYAW